MKVKLIIFWMLFVLCSCVSLHDKPMSMEDMQLEVLGEISVSFHTFQPLHIPFSGAIKKNAYNRLMQEATRKWGNRADIDIKNITIKNIAGVGYPDVFFRGDLGFIDFYPFWLFGIGPIVVAPSVLFNTQGVYARGTAIITATSVDINAIEIAVEKIALSFAEKIPRGSAIAVLNISSAINANYIIDEIEFRLVEKGSNFRIVERRRLDEIRNEQNFHLSGEISDESAVSIGQLLGANIVIIGSITNIGGRQRLIIKALDVETGEIVAMTREDI